ncbi:hypothetical protein [Kribbella sindirgiensis]|uniref:Uncharacterized protein n=1 Tax=Kribbella sindirgiensis TaxID=1124744 RepID=A0A4R0IBS4_9ACTN|nr:hypothetical protein [Kribbella sindirgiensis]TCC19972.1 hypothetical protein E0H50_37750 [Kribbella sindirgiensis]
MFQTVHSASMLGVPFVLTMLGVTLFVDIEGEDCYMTVSHDHEPEALRLALDTIDRLGLEVVPEEESEWEVDDEVTKCILAEARPANGLRVVA